MADVLSLTWHSANPRTSRTTMTPDDNGEPFNSDAQEKDASFDVYFGGDKVATVYFRGLIYGVWTDHQYRFYQALQAYADIYDTIKARGINLSISGKCTVSSTSKGITGTPLYRFDTVQTIVSKTSSYKSYPGDSDSLIYYEWYDLDIKAQDSSTSSSLSQKRTAQHRVNYSKAVFTVKFNLDKGTGSFEDQKVYWGETVSNPGTPGKPTDSPDRKISIIFDNGENSTPTKDNSADNTLTGSWSYYWDPSLSTKIYDDTTIKTIWDITSESNFIKLPATAPVLTGYIFKGWYTGKNGTGNLVGDSAGGTSDIKFSWSDNGKTVYAKWEEVESEYTILYKAKVGEAEFEIKDKDGKSSQDITVKYTQEVTPTLPDIVGYNKPTSFIILSYPGDPSKIGKEVTSIKGSYPAGSIFGAYYLPITYSVSLDLRGGTINGSTTVDPITYNILSEKINLREYSPIKNNTTFVGWVGSDNQYKDEIDPTKEEWQVRSQTLWADYIPLGKFVYTSHGWTPIINTWIYSDGEWKGYSKDPSKLVNTTPVAYVKTDSGWMIEYGGENRPK